MPALVLFGHRTLVAGDDLRISCIAMISFRILQFILLVKVLIYALDIDRGDFRDCIDENDHGNIAQVAEELFYVYWTTSLLLVIVGVAVELSIWITSMQGTPTQPEKRRRLGPLCKVKLIGIGVWRITVTTFGILLLATLNEYCECMEGDVPQPRTRILLDFDKECSKYDHLHWTLAVLVFTHLLETCFSAAFALWLFMAKVRPRQRVSSVFGSFLNVSREQQWAGACRCCCTCSSLVTCCVFGGSESVNGDFTDISIALSRYFDNGGKLDITLSDIAAGLVMLVRLQEERRLECWQSFDQADENTNQEECDIRPAIPREETANLGDDEGDVEVSLPTKSAEIENQDQSEHQDTGRRKMAYQTRRSGSELVYQPCARALLSGENEDDAATIAEGAHFIRVSVAIYAWIMYFKNHTSTAHCVFIGSWLRDLVKCSHHQWCCKPKPNIVGDNGCSWNETALLREAGLDESDIAYGQFRVGVAVTPYCIAIDHQWKSIVLAVRGTLSFDDVLADITISPAPLDQVGQRCGFDGRGERCHAGILACAEWIYSDLESHGILDTLLLNSSGRFPGYKFRIVGHSLGAGCAAILALMLRNKYPELQCLCFEPPGCVLSMRSAQLCRSYVTSYVHDADIICRLSMQSMENLRNDVLEMIARIKVAKYQVLKKRFKQRDVSHLIEEQLHRRESTPESEFSRQLAEFKEHQKQRKLEGGMDDVRMYPPGKILLMLRNSEPKSSLRALFAEPVSYTAQWSMNDDLSEILISSHMMSDHDGKAVRGALEQLASSFKL